MIIRKYAQFPMTFVPDVGEVVMARRSPVDAWLRAVVTHVRRQRTGKIKLTVLWLDSDPHAGAQGPKPIVANTKGWVEFFPERQATLIRQLYRD